MPTTFLDVVPLALITHPPKRLSVLQNMAASQDDDDDDNIYDDDIDFKPLLQCEHQLQI